MNAFFALSSYPILLFIHAPFKNNRVLIPGFLLLLFSVTLYISVEKWEYSAIGSILFILVLFAVVCFEILFASINFDQFEKPDYKMLSYYFF